jgi:predicted DNA-binding antitoxin AbrB/MazE fold protein
VKAYKKIPDYAMSHRPTQSGSGYNIDEFGNAPDFYKNPRFFKYSSDGTYDESISALLKIKDKPEATITIYRASPQNDLNFGDWVSLSKKYAKQASLSEGTKVHSFKVKAKDIQFAGDDINEFGYYPTDETIKEKWFSLQPKTNNPKDYKNANDFIDAMYEKGIFKNIESSQKRWEKEMELEEIWNKANKSPLPKAKEVSENVNVLENRQSLTYRI